MTLAQEYGNLKALAVLGLSNWGGIEILAMNCDDVVACFNFGSGRSEIRRHKLVYTSTGRAYFRKAGHRYYLDQFMA